jgi:hypothetical protein
MPVKERASGLWFRATEAKAFIIVWRGTSCEGALRRWQFAVDFRGSGSVKTAAAAEVPSGGEAVDSAFDVSLTSGAELIGTWELLGLSDRAILSPPVEE